MLSTIKFYLRKQRAAGKYIKLINLLAVANYKYKSINQWMVREKAHKEIKSINLEDKNTDWVTVIFDMCDGFFKPLQNHWEISQLVDELSKKPPQKILEIGTASGGTLFLLARAASKSATLVSLDLPHGKNGGGFPTWKVKLYQHFASAEQSIHFIRGNSHELSTKEKAENLINKEKYDLIMIDADHSYEGVKRDFLLYSPLVKKGGIIVLHDVIPNIFDPEIKVDLFWDELKTNFKTKEIVHDYNQGNFGIGIVYL